MTEEEAKAKWCPFARVIASMGGAEQFIPAPEVAPHNRVQHPNYPDEAVTHSAHACLASDCMAWRWREQVERTTTLYSGEPAPGPEWAMDGEPWDADPNKVLTSPAMLQRWHVPAGAPHGFCGLAGGGA